jgi:glutamyl-tRNA reductase
MRISFLHPHKEPPVGHPMTFPVRSAFRYLRRNRSMKIQVFGCSHHSAPICVREQLAFAPSEVEAALSDLRAEFPRIEAVLVSTCNRVELYSAAPRSEAPSSRQWVDFLARFHGVDSGRILSHLYVRENRAAVRHLFLVASSLDSMVVGEPQILAQVKAAYQLADQMQTAGPVVHALFQVALKTARRVANETALHRHRVSVPSVAVADFARRVFTRFDDKRILVIGAGEMAEEAIKYLRAAGATTISVINRHLERAEVVAERWQGYALRWEHLWQALTEADLVVSATGSPTTVVSLPQFLSIESARNGRPLVILDLAVPRDFDPAIARRPDVHLFSVDDLKAASDRNQQARDDEMPAALNIIDEGTEQFMTELNRRALAPTIRRLQQAWHRPKDAELTRLFNKLPQLSGRAREEIERSFDRLLGKLTHRPLESLRAESRDGVPTALLQAVDTLFQLK